MVFHEEDLEKLEDFSKMRNKIKKKIKKISGRCSIKSNYKIYKKKHKKNLFLEITTPDGSEFWENEIGKKYLIYVNFQDIDSETISILGHLTQLQYKYELKGGLDVDFIAFLYVTEETEYNEDGRIFKNKFTIYIINENQVINLYHCVNPFDNEFAHVFLYIDEEGYLHPFSISDINLVEEKLEELLKPKIEITKDQYKLAKNESNRFFMQDFLSFDEYKYRFTFGITLEKNKIYNRENILSEEKFYCRGVLKIRDTDMEAEVTKHIKSKDGDENEKLYNFDKNNTLSAPFSSIYSFGSKIGEILQKECEDFIRIENHKTFNLALEETELSCHNCKEFFTDLCLIYLCYFDSLVYCRKCVGSEEKILKCSSEHNLITIINYKKTLESGNLVDLEVHKIGNNSFNFFKQIPKYDQGFCCSYCDITKNESVRYICLNCRGSNMILHCEGDSNANGYVDVCQDCFSLLNDHCKGTLEPALKLKAEYLIETVEDRDRHYFDSHVYIKLNYPSGSYYIY